MSTDFNKKIDEINQRFRIMENYGIHRYAGMKPQKKRMFQALLGEKGYQVINPQRLAKLSTDPDFIKQFEDVIKNVHEVLNNIKKYSENIRNGKKTGFTGKKLKNFISIGIGGSYLGPEFVYQSIKLNDKYVELSKDLNLLYIFFVINHLRLKMWYYCRFFVLIDKIYLKNLNINHYLHWHNYK